jgi:hypothetical protein
MNCGLHARLAALLVSAATGRTRLHGADSAKSVNCNSAKGKSRTDSSSYRIDAVGTLYLSRALLLLRTARHTLDGTEHPPCPARMITRD